MFNDPIVAEIRRIRQRQAAKHNYDIDAIVEAARQAQWQSGHEVVRLATKKTTMKRGA